MSLAGYMNISSNALDTFTNAKDNDLLVFTESNIQKMLFGVSSNANASLTINSNLCFFNSNTAIGTSNVSELFEVYGGNAKFGSNLYVMSNVSIGKSNANYALDVSGSINFTTSLLKSGVDCLTTVSNAAIYGSNTSVAASNTAIFSSNKSVAASNTANTANSTANTANSTANTANSTANTANSLAIYASNIWKTNGTSIYAISGNNVGIATTSPQYGLDVNTNAIVRGGLTVLNSGLPLYVIANTNNNNPTTNGIYVYNSTNSAGNHAIIATRVVGASGGNPYYSMDIAGVFGWSMGIDNADSDKFKIMSSFDFGSSPRLTIDLSGNVGIGTTNPSRTLDVNGAASVNSLYSKWFELNNANKVNGNTLYFGNGTNNYAVQQIDNAGANYLRMGGWGNDDITINTSGNICIGTNVPYNSSTKLTVAGSATVNNVNVTSDDRLKDEEVFITDAITTVMKLRPQKYKKFQDLVPNREPDAAFEIESGLIAQEVYYGSPELRHLVSLGQGAEPTSIAPSFIAADDPIIDPDYSSWGEKAAGLNYTGLIPYLIKAIQEQQGIIDKQQATIESILAKL
jgi:hypothetical protein